MNKYDITLAGLLHDIGKFFEKANNKGNSIGGIEVSVKHHAITSANFIKHFRDKIESAGFDIEALIEMVQRHHEDRKGGEVSIENAPIEYRPYCYIVGKADNLSSAERFNTREYYKDYQLRRITNIFSLLAGEVYTQEAGKYNEVYGNVSNKVRLNDEKTNKDMVEAFIEEFDKIDISGIEGNKQRVFISRVNKVLREYTWCYPSDTREYIRDISLYSHLQTTAAIACILYDDLTLNPEYKKGLSSDKVAIGWKFTEVSIKELRTQHIEVVKIQLANAMDIITSTNITDIDNVRAKLIKYKRDLTKKIYDELAITAVNNICSDDYSSILMVRDRAAKKVIEEVKGINRSLPQFEGKPVIFFEATYSKLELDELVSNDTGKFLSKLNNAMNSKWENTEDSIGYVGINSLLVKDEGRWGSVEVRNIDTLNEFASYRVLKSSKHDLINKLNEKAIAIVKIKIDNYNEIISKMLSMTFGDTNGILQDNNKERRVGTICRLSALMDQINKLVEIAFKDCIYLYRGQDGVMLVTTLDNAFKVGGIYRRIIAKQSINQLKSSLFIETIYSNGIEFAFRGIAESSNNEQADKIYYNGLCVSEEQFNRIQGISNIIREGLKLEASKATTYKILEFIGMYEEYCKSGNTHNLMCIPRLNYSVVEKANDKNITKELKNLITTEFEKVSKSSEPAKANTDLSLIKNIMYDTIQSMR